MILKALNLDLKIPKRLRWGLKPLRKGTNVDLLSIGADTETNQGPPCTFQFFSGPEDLNFQKISIVREDNATETALRDFSDILGSRDACILWAFNFNFDLISLFYDLRWKFLDERFNFDAFGWNFRGVRVQRGAVFGTLRQEGTRRKIYLRDTARFYQGNLASVAKIFCPDLPKLPKPEGLGQRALDPALPEDRAYMIRDAEIPYYIGKGILKWFERFDVPLCTSSADFAGKVFRRRFLPPQGLHYPSAAGVGAAYLAYHGGKNLYPAGKPMRYKDVYSLDIRSAYPYAMTQLPDFGSAKRYKWGSFADLCPVPSRECWGIFKVSGTARKCPWPVVYGPKMKVITGEFSGLWIAGPELYEALASGELELKSAWGFVYEDDPEAPHPFREFAEHFYSLRQAAGSIEERETYKIILNSLSGKLAEVRKSPEDITEVTDDGPVIKLREGITGPLFHPVAAALITSYIRALIHPLEHKYQAIHTSTDGFLTLIPPDPLDLSETLGGLKLEVKGATLDVLRNKLYLLRDENGAILKEARHGFRGKVDALIDCIDNGRLEYDYVRCNSLKESFRRGLVVNRFDTYRARIKLKGAEKKCPKSARKA